MVSFNDLSARLRASSATWTARQTPQFLLSDEQKARLLGVVIDDADLAAAMAPRAEAEAPNFAQAVDWRNRNGNHVTPVQNQAGCGSCVSFCTVATVESMASIELGQKLNLSEADLHFCSDHGPSCGGWWPTNAYNALKNRGVADKACFPYPVNASGNVNPACATCADRDARAVKVTDSTTLSSATERKNWLTNVGPCSAVIRVFDDFFAYGGGVYRHVVDNNPSTPDDVERGLHCVEIIGYSEAEQCWICKNSWGPTWGNQGFGKIGYGEIGIDTDFPFWTARGVKLPPFRGWSGWFALGTPAGCFVGAPPVISRNNSVCNIYVRGTDNALWQRAWYDNKWHDWSRHNDGGVLASEPALGSMGPNHEHVFVRGTDSQVWQKYWTAKDSWSGWFALGAPAGGFVGAPSVISRNGSVCNIYVRGTDNALWQRAWYDNKWHDWGRHNDGGVLASEPALGSMGPNHEHVFVRGTDSQVWQKYWTAKDGWSGWFALGAPVGGFVGAPSVISRNGSVCNIYVRGTDNALWQRAWYDNKWHDWGRHNDGGVLASEPALGSMGPNHEHVFVRGTDSQVWQKYWQG